MNLKQLENIVAISEEGNISHAAEKLFISQSALSQCLINLEKELGLVLFKRVNKKMILTYAGENYINASKNILEIKRKTYKILSDISQNRKGSFLVGITSVRGIRMFSSIYPKFHEVYPEVIIKTKESGAKDLENMVLRGEIDIGTVSTKNYPNALQYELVDTEEIFVMIPITHPLSSLASSENSGGIRIEELALLKDEKFIATNKDTALREITDKLCQKAGFSPNVIFESSSVLPIIKMVQGAMGVGIISEKGLENLQDTTLLSFEPKQIRSLWATYRKDNYLAEPERHYIDLIKNYYKTL